MFYVLALLPKTHCDCSSGQVKATKTQVQALNVLKIMWPKTVSPVQWQLVQRTSSGGSAEVMAAGVQAATSSANSSCLLPQGWAAPSTGVKARVQS